jgi:hypothetical protein
MGLAPVNERERLRDRIDLIIVTHARKSEQLGHEFIQPRRILPEKNHAGVEVGGLRGQPHNLVAFQLGMVLVGIDPLLFEGLNQARSGALVLDDEVGVSAGAIIPH